MTILNHKNVYRHFLETFEFNLYFYFLFISLLIIEKLELEFIS